MRIGINHHFIPMARARRILLSFKSSRWGKALISRVVFVFLPPPAPFGNQFRIRRAASAGDR